MTISISFLFKNTHFFILLAWLCREFSFCLQSREFYQLHSRIRSRRIRTERKSRRTKGRGWVKLQSSNAPPADRRIVWHCGYKSSSRNLHEIYSIPFARFNPSYTPTNRHHVALVLRCVIQSKCDCTSRTHSLTHALSLFTLTSSHRRLYLPQKGRGHLTSTLCLANVVNSHPGNAQDVHTCTRPNVSHATWVADF